MAFSSTPTVDLARQLVRIPSVTPFDGGCQGVVARRLERLGFTVTPLVFGEVANFYARLGRRGSNFCFAGHTDVTPSGDARQWRTDPFAAEILDGVVVGRGICDMKGAVAAMVVAVERLLERYPDFTDHHSLSFLVTGDEEGQATDGTVRVLEWCVSHGERLDFCLVGEPTSVQRLGDCVKNGRRGSVNGVVTLHGLQGHVAYPHLAANPIHLCLPVLDSLVRHPFDPVKNSFFPPTSLQLTRIHAGDGSANVIPGDLSVQFNIRFSTEHTPESLESTIRALLAPLNQTNSRFDLSMQVSGHPFLTEGGPLLVAIQGAVGDLLGLTPEPSTSGGTSDARFISRHCPQTVEFGLVGATMHKVDEATPVHDLENLARIYQRVVEKLLIHP